MSEPINKESPESFPDRVLLGRQPIFDTTSSVVAYELLFRKTSTESANVPDASMATSQVVVDTLSTIGIDRVLSGKKGFINIGEEFLFSDNIFLIPPDRLGLEILETVPINDPVIKRLKELKKLGYSLAIDDFTEEPGILEPIIDIIDVLKVDFPMVSRKYVETIHQKVRNKNVKLLAEKVEKHEQVSHASQFFFSLFQGFFYERPTIIAENRVGLSQASLLGILALALKDDVKMDDLHSLIKPHIELALSLIKLSNIVGQNPNKKINTIKDAIISIGLNNLRRWLLLLVTATSSSTNPYSRSILHIGAQRARTMELIALKWNRADRPDPNQAFLVGILSTMDTLIGISLELLLKELRLGESIRDALLLETGPLGQLLDLAKAMGHDDFNPITSLLESIPVSSEEAVSTQSQAILWADGVIQSIS